ncbi:hypothetical protein HZS_4273 [Henneguya salminicola]|nr:hypothetical protein HZS_4273 [Henneguya salminicola]
MMTLSDAYCRINRARGINLLSPSDFLSSCKVLAQIRDTSVQMKLFPSGLYYLTSLNEDSFVDIIAETATKSEPLSSLMMSQQLNISSVLALEL